MTKDPAYAHIAFYRLRGPAEAQAFLRRVTGHPSP